jgi:hypothetical protein
MSVGFLALVYENADRGGRARLLGVPAESRYSAINATVLKDWDLYDQVSSVSLYAATRGTSNMLLFEHDAFSGSFRQLVYSQSAGSIASNLADHSFNDKASSVLLIGSDDGAEFRVSFRDLFLQQWRDLIDPALGDRASRQGDPVMTWEMFPAAIDHLDPNRTYLKIHQNLRIDVSAWPDYDASITYHIELYRDTAGHPRGWTARWAYWVEAGLKSDEIGDALEPQVIDGADLVQARLDDSFNDIQVELRDLYLLPGSQRTPFGEGMNAGDTHEDTTIVFVV